MFILTNNPKLNDLQIKGILEELQKNPSLRWDGNYSFYSNGVCVIRVFWDFDESKKDYEIKFNLDGSINL
jgi:hypothetical protein